MEHDAWSLATKLFADDGTWWLAGKLLALLVVVGLATWRLRWRREHEADELDTPAYDMRRDGQRLTG